MANQVTGRLVEIGQTQQIASKTGGNPFLKRDFLLDARTYDPYTGQPSEYENLLPLELGGERCADLDRFRAGDTVTVSFALQGRSWTNRDGEQKRMVSIRCYRIEPYGKSPATPSPSPSQPSPEGRAYGTYGSSPLGGVEGAVYPTANDDMPF